MGLLDSGFNKETRAFTHREYVSIYDVCYKMCTQRAPQNWSEQLYEKHGEVFRTYLHDRVLPALKGKRDVYVLRELTARWDNHNIMNKWMFKFLMYLVSLYIRR